MRSVNYIILLVAAVPLLALMAVGGFTAYNRLSEAAEMQRLVPLVDLSRDASAVIHELQIERGQTVGLISSNYAADAAERVAQQRQRADAAIAEYETMVAGFRDAAKALDLEQPLAEIDAALSSIAEHRDQVDAHTVTVPKNVGFYSDAIGRLLTVISVAARSSPTRSIAAELLPFQALVLAKENAGLERAIGAALLNGLANGTFDFNRFQAFFANQISEKAYLANFRKFATPEQRTLFDATVSGPDIETFEAWREILDALPETRDAAGLTGAEWFAGATQRINLIKSVEDTTIANARVVAQREADALSSYAYRLILVMLVMTVAVAAFAIAVGNRLTKALKDITGIVGRLAEGQLVEEIDHIERSDEIGQLARAALVFRDHEEARREARGREEEEAQSKIARQEKMDSLIAEFRPSVQALLAEVTGSMDEMRSTAGLLTELSDVTAQKAGGASDASENAAGNVHVVAAAAEQLSSSISEISQQLARLTEVVSRAMGTTRTTSDNISGLDTAAQKIGEVVTLIQDIAEKTNLLALNATIEAARAGEMGKGFAVVASEVKALANQTARATEDIAAQVSAIQHATVEAVEGIQGISAVMEEVDTYAATIAAAIEQQGSATSEISRNVGEAASGTKAVVGNVGDIGDAVEESTQAAQQMRNATNSVASRAQALGASVEAFLDEVAAA